MTKYDNKGRLFYAFTPDPKNNTGNLYVNAVAVDGKAYTVGHVPRNLSLAVIDPDPTGEKYPAALTKLAKTICCLDAAVLDLELTGPGYPVGEPVDGEPVKITWIRLSDDSQRYEHHEATGRVERTRGPYGMVIVPDDPAIRYVCGSIVTDMLGATLYGYLNKAIKTTDERLLFVSGPLIRDVVEVFNPGREAAADIIASQPYTQTGTVQTVTGAIITILTDAGNTYTCNALYPAYTGDRVLVIPDGTGGYYATLITGTTLIKVGTSQPTAILCNGCNTTSPNDMSIPLGSNVISWDGTGNVYLLGYPGTDIVNDWLFVGLYLSVTSTNGTINTPYPSDIEFVSCNGNWTYYFYAGVLNITSILSPGTNRITLSVPHATEWLDPTCPGNASTCYLASTNIHQGVPSIYIIAR
jgi:hypothetical protein